ncbi:hypothetical protein IIA79_05605 [bacterium]|nr:hypothetical protein [bacterium]
MTIPVEAGNEMVRDPEFGNKMEEIFGRLKPEAAYFSAENGQRTMYFFINMEDSSELPGIAEPFWLAMEADVECIPVMNKDDLAKAAPSIQEAVSKY